MKTLLLLAVTLPQVCYVWIDRFGGETPCQQAKVVQIGHSSRFKIKAPPRPKGTVMCLVYTNLTGKITYKDYCDGYMIDDGRILGDDRKKPPHPILISEGKCPN